MSINMGVNRKMSLDVVRIMTLVIKVSRTKVKSISPIKALYSH